MKRLLALTSFALSALALGAAAPAAAPLNLVWIIADDMSLDLAAYGATGVKTPNLDRLAAQGRRYTRAYVSAPICSASRSAFILGCYQTTTGLHPHDMENPQPLPAPYRPLPELLREAGWFVTNAAAPGAQRGGRTITRAKTHYNFAHDPKKLYDGDDWRQRRPGQPFFAQFQITEPHRPLPVPERFDEAAVAAIPLPPHYPDHPLMRRDWYAYLRSVETVDRRVGVILDQLAAEGVLDRTVIMFFADNGRPMPWGKQWLTEEGLHVPLIVRGPGITAGSVEERLVSLIDLAPTALALAGRPVPAWMEGRDFLAADFPDRPHLFAARDRCGDAMDRIRAVITRDQLFVRNFFPEVSHLNWSGYKEASYPGMPLLRVLHAQGRLDAIQAAWMAPGRAEYELYDLRRDPATSRNLATDSRLAATITAFNRTLETWIAASGDRGVRGDPATEPPLADIQKAKRGDYAKAWLGRVNQPDPTDAERLAWWLRTYGLAAAAAR
ncbi:MAG: sulfatase [Verrucomicrobia bacterium]|nr:sulfatase [Verrucomicrobiota bacterium]